MQYGEWVDQAVARLPMSDSAKRDAEILLQHITGRSRTFIFAFSETELTQPEYEALESLLCRREQGEPIAYIIGEREFWSLPLFVSPATLIPRPDTECLVEQALARLPAQRCQILDLGTGTGAIALAIASERPDSVIIGIDFNLDAVSLAQRNQQRLALNNVQFLQSDWFTSLSCQHFDMIVSNPPYIDGNDDHLQQGDVRFEPLTALVADNHGLSDLDHIVSTSRSYLNPQGWLLVEHGWQQGAAVRELFKQYGYSNIETCLDYGGRDRISLGQWNKSVEM
ncbi:TPA: peptide chain release factor N(5)-glutamine methyltransferase [Providencia stuartii]|uniref:peptide chain release factor N(5)-glutamine methyltransferase n=1 Tax=Providencia stuartii TaxID=588 RepID=UPI00113FCAE6|nr:MULTISPECIES: peptide chain release factor N(5)-glutamine methyltransferase [Providencia]MBN5561837.1 peptide chain release factor N(5)-glutamine methyltransferase [Providencia stuartii]MBN5601683.1 peptide chain release factor N(5)-glutamine methyltransferase [Providencia stuartii]MBN5605769.1 peptide chain release factor N(5)-glutamine methyltransferase [Providencia stuartii]MCL8324554.1 peptide chain release factor N(5)-glutamine methyltransferase [Providencia thailandensis]MDF4175422.1 